METTTTMNPRLIGMAVLIIFGDFVALALEWIFLKNYSFWEMFWISALTIIVVGLMMTGIYILIIHINGSGRKETENAQA